MFKFALSVIWDVHSTRQPASKVTAGLIVVLEIGATTQSTKAISHLLSATLDRWGRQQVQPSSLGHLEHHASSLDHQERHQGGLSTLVHQEPHGWH